MNTEKLIAKAHSLITRIKGKEYAPTSIEIQEWLDKNINILVIESTMK